MIILIVRDSKKGNEKETIKKSISEINQNDSLENLKND